MCDYPKELILKHVELLRTEGLLRDARCWSGHQRDALRYKSWLRRSELTLLLRGESPE